MKKIYLLLIAVCLTSSISKVFGQAKKPTLMILPSDNWCEQRYFNTEFNNQGTKQKVKSILTIKILFCFLRSGKKY